MFVFLFVSLFVASGSKSCGGDVGFDTWFTTNLDEYENYPILFDGPIPSWIKGTLIRNGPAQYEMGKRRFSNTLDGFAKLNAWRFPGNGLTYFSTKFIRSEVYEKSNATKDIDPHLNFEAVEPPFNVMQKLMTVERGIDNMNVNVYNLSSSADGNFLYALTDAWKVYEFDASLRTKSVIDPELPHSPGDGFVNSMSCAHPLPEYGTNNHFTFYTSLSLLPDVKSRQTPVRVKSATEREYVAQWEINQVSYIHSFAVSQNYVIFFNAPYFVHWEKLVETGTVVDALEWHIDVNATAYVIHISTGKVKSFEIDNAMILHHINAYENPGDGTLIVDVSSHKTPFFSEVFRLSNILDPIKRNIPQYVTDKRYTFHLSKGKVDIQAFKNTPDAPCVAKLDIPTINEKYRSQKYCFAYGLSYNCDGKGFAHIAIAKKDVCGQNRDKILYISNHFPTEVWFIPSPNGIDEDDGVLMTAFLDGEKKQSYLAIIDAKTLIITHRAVLPTVVPFNFHGRFFTEIY